MEEKEPWKDEPDVGQVSHEEEIQPPSPGSHEEILPEKPAEAAPPKITYEDHTDPWLKGLTAGKYVPPQELQPSAALPPEELPVEKPVETAAPQFPEGLDTDAWLDVPAAMQQKHDAEELLPHPSHLAETQPEGMETPGQDLVPQEKTPSIKKTAAQPEEDITITSWLNKHDVEAALGKPRSASHKPPSSELPKEDLPDWLKEPEHVLPMDNTAQQATIGENMPGSESIPEWLGQAKETVDHEEQPVSGLKTSAEQELPPWVDKSTPPPVSPAPTNPGEWISAEEKPVLPPKAAPVPQVSGVSHGYSTSAADPGRDRHAFPGPDRRQGR